MRLVLLGAPGAGKGTQGKMLEERFKIPHISTGDILRDTTKKKNLLSRETTKFLEAGKLVPDRIVIQIIKDRLKKTDTLKGFILDGFPRNTFQAEALDDFLKRKNLSIDGVIYLDTEETVLIERLKARRICVRCRALFHLKNSPPKKDSICDFCGAKLYQREDDKERTVKERFRIYKKETESLIDYYLRQKRLVRVCADSDKETVFGEIFSKIRKYATTNYS